MTILTDLNNKYLLCLDTETAQLGDHVCEIGFSIFIGKKLRSEWGTFVKPIIPIEPEASNVHHIYEKDVENAPTFKDIALLIHGMLSGVDCHLAYNYEYDRIVFEREFDRIGMRFPVRSMIDPLVFFRKFHKFRRGKKLVDAAQEYGIPYVGAHRAVNDAIMAGLVFQRMAATKTAFPKDIKKLVKQQRELVEAQYKDFAAYRKRVGQSPPDEPNYYCYEL